MSNPNIVTVFSPDGDRFEMSRINARDLVNHRGWSMSPLTVPPTKAETKEETNAEADTTGEADDVEGEGAEGSTGGEASDPEQEDVLTTSDAPYTTEEQFAELTEREDVVAYLAKHFPDFEPHHRSRRDGLVTKAIELATGE
jgi:hypothetical protein